MRRTAPFTFLRAPVLLGALLGLHGCGGNKPPSFVSDTGVDSATDGSQVVMDAAGDAIVDAGADATIDLDAGFGDGGVDCVFGTAMPLITSANQPSMVHVPFAAEANVGGVFVAAPSRSETTYPNYERIGVLLSTAGVIFSATNLSNAASASSPSSAMSLTHSGSGFLALFDEGSPSNVFVRPVSETGTATGTATAIASSLVGQTEGRILRTSAGFVAAWTEATETRIALLDTGATIVGTPTNPTVTIGTPNARRLYTINGAPYLAYVGTDARIHSIAINSVGSVTGSPATLSAQDGTTNFGIAGSTSGAGLVYEALTAGTTSIWFRAISATGTAMVAERRLTAIDDHGERPSIAQLAGGYLVLFRLDPAFGSDKLRLLVLSTSGDLLGTVDLADPFADDLRYTLAVSPDGSIFVALEALTTITLDGGPTLDGTSLRAFRIVCE